MMAGEILINYEQVAARTAALKSQINSDLLVKIENEYAQIEEMLSNSGDGGANAKLKEGAQEHKKKSIAMCEILDKLLTFMAHSSVEFERNEKEMAAVISADVSSESSSTKGGAA